MILFIEDNNNDPIETCESIVIGMQNPPQLCHAGDEAFYHSGLDYINMPMINNFDDSESYYSTLFHELVHATGHSKRLNREKITESNAFGSEAYLMEELVVELGACYLNSHIGIGREIDNCVANRVHL